MKKTLLAVALTSLLPITAVADVVVYGKANVAVQNADEVALDGSRVELVSNSSRIGVKGGEDVNSRLKVIYQFEYQTEVDDSKASNGQTFAPRNIFLGLQGSAGTLMGGHFDTPTKVAQEKVDVFNDLEGDLISIFRGEIRASNVIQYTTPSFGGGFSGSVAYVTEEADGTYAAANPAGEESAGVSTSFGYTSAAFYVGAAMDQDIEADGVDLYRLVARANFGPVQLGLLGEKYENDNTGADEDGVLASVLWSLTDKWAVKAQYGQSDVKMADGETASFGVDYKMTKAATLYGYATKVENGLLEDQAGARDDTYIGAGVDFKF